MKSKEIFSLAVRLLGLWFVYHGFTNLPMVFETSKALLFVIFYFGAAWWLIGGASLLVRRAYPEFGEQSPNATKISGETTPKTEI